MSRKPTGTRERLLDAACELIAEKGYEATTHQDICDKAGANIAAINYYFRNKETLYEAVWERAADLADTRHPVPAPGSGTPEEMLTGYVRARLECVFDDGPGGWLPRIIFRAVGESDPGQLEHFFQTYLHPKMKGLLEPVRVLLGPKASEMQIRCCAFSIHSQCIHLNVARIHNRGILSFKNAGPDECEAIIENMLQFILGGVWQMRRTIENGSV